MATEKVPGTVSLEEKVNIGFGVGSLFIACILFRNYPVQDLFDAVCWMLWMIVISINITEAISVFLKRLGITINLHNNTNSYFVDRDLKETDNIVLTKIEKDSEVTK